MAEILTIAIFNKTTEKLTLHSFIEVEEKLADCLLEALIELGLTKFKSREGYSSDSDWVKSVSQQYDLIITANSTKIGWKYVNFN